LQEIKEFPHEESGFAIFPVTIFFMSSIVVSGFSIPASNLANFELSYAASQVFQMESPDVVTKRMVTTIYDKSGVLGAEQQSRI
jgi:hypothetical protein